ncbi:MAG TPA: STAS domain-containing protein [Micromonosporaceae bacterium]|nr:STAS domain-containing protein [Micromonosporaceae bacterium]
MDQTVRVSPTSDGLLSIELFGEIDFSNCAAVVAEVSPAVTDARPREVRVDLSGVTFLDSSGIGVLVTVYRAALAADAGYRVVSPTRFVYEQLRMTGLVDLFGIEPPAMSVS